MANSGLKIVTKLRKYINGRPTDEVKNNTRGTEGYIPDVVAKEDCPVGCDAVIQSDVVVRGTTTTTTTTTIAVTPEPNLVKSYNIFNGNNTLSATVEYTDEYNQTQEVNLPTNTSSNVISRTEPNTVSGTQVTIESVGSVFEATTTTTTKAIVQSTDYTIDTSSATENTVISLTQFRTAEAAETEIAPGKVVTVSSDTVPTIVSGDQSTTITDTGTVTPEEDTYTITNDNYYESTTVEFRPLGGVTDEVELAPRETKEVKSQDTPTVSSGSTNVTITADGNPTQEADLATIPKRICNQHNLTNDSDYIATFEFIDCDLVDREVTLEPREEVSVPSVIIPVLTTETETNVGTSFTVTEITKDYGTSGTATDIATTTTTSTTTTTTTTTISPDSLTETNIVSLQDLNCGEDYVESKPDGIAWYPETVKIYVGPKTGDFKFISFDSGYEGNLYKVYEGATLLLDKAMITDAFQQRFIKKMYDALIDQGMSNLSALDYTYGSKRVEPTKDLTQVNPRDLNYRTEFTITKTTFDEFITVEIYKPILTGNWVTFRIECIQ